MERMEVRKNCENKEECAMEKMFDVQGRVIIDWNEGREALLRKGIEVREIFGGEEWCLEVQGNCVVRNFPKLLVEEARLTDCVFENCGSLTIEDGTAKNCEFTGIKTLFLTRAKVYDSQFHTMHCDWGELLISLEDSAMSGCRFRDIRLENGAYLCDAVGDCYLKKCRFENITTDRADRQIVICKETTGRIFKRTKEYDIVDSSCVGLDRVKYLG